MNEEEYCVIRSIQQLLTIGAQLDVGDEQDPTQYPLEIPVTDPTWCFPDGNVSWHLRIVEPHTAPATTLSPTVFGPPYSAERFGLTPAILTIVQPIPAVAAYLPLNGGYPYGAPAMGLGTFYDVRFPWGQRQQHLNLREDGMCQVVMYASVFQTDPDTRVQPPAAADGTYLRQEDRFVMNHDTARYWRVGARMEVDIYHRDEVAARY